MKWRHVLMSLLEDIMSWKDGHLKRSVVKAEDSDSIGQTIFKCIVEPRFGYLRYHLGLKYWENLHRITYLLVDVWIVDLPPSTQIDEFLLASSQTICLSSKTCIITCNTWERLLKGEQKISLQFSIIKTMYIDSTCIDNTLQHIKCANLHILKLAHRAAQHVRYLHHSIAYKISTYTLKKVKHLCTIRHHISTALPSTTLQVASGLSPWIGFVFL